MLIDLSFLLTNWIKILFIVLIFLILLGTFAYLGLNFNKPKPTKVEKVVVIESFNENNDTIFGLNPKEI
jgi:hypothetical protein